MNEFALMTLVLAAWIPLTVVAFWGLGPRRGSLVAVVGGHVVLPMWAVLARFSPPLRWANLSTKWYSVIIREVWLELRRPEAIGLAVLAALVLTQGRALRRWRPSWWDLGALLLVAYPLTGLAADGTTARGDAVGLAVQRLIGWLPLYAAGRLFFDDAQARRQIAGAIILSGLVLVPVAIYEQAAGPDRYVMRLIYGFDQDRAALARQGGLRPVGFMGNGVEFTNWLAIAAVVAVAAWVGGGWRPRRGPAWWPALILVPFTVLARGMYAQVYLVLGVAAVLLRRVGGDRAMIVGIMLCVPLYMGLRYTRVIDRDQMSTNPWIQSLDKSRSLFVRLRDEDHVMDTLALRAPWLGMGAAFGHAAIVAPEMTAKVGDGIWIREAFAGGLLGLLVYYGAVHVIPIGLTLRRHGPAEEDNAEDEADDTIAVAMALVSALSMLDGLHNLTLPPPVALMAGALVSRALTAPAARRDDRRTTAAEATAGSVPESVPIVAGLAALLVLLGPPLARPVPGLATVAVGLMLGLAGWAGGWAAARFGLWRAAAFAAVFAGLGLLFNLMQDPTPRAITTVGLFQALAFAGLAAGLLDRATGGRAWLSIGLAALPLAATYVVAGADTGAATGQEALSALLGYELPPIVGFGRAMLPAGVWLLVGLLGIVAARESWGWNLATGVLFGAAGGIFATAGRAWAPDGLDATLLACAGIALGFAAARLLASHAARRPLRRLGRYWLLLAILVPGLTQLLAPQRGTLSEPVAGLAVSAAALGLAWLTARLLSIWQAGFRGWLPWFYLAWVVPILLIVPSLLPAAISVIGGVSVLVLGAQYGGLASCVARFDPRRLIGSRL